MNFSYYIKLAAVLTLICVIASWFLVARFGSGRLRVYYLDTGQGDATLIISPDNKALMIDTGPNGIVVDKLKSILPPFFAKLDLIIISHEHLDHIGGLTDIVKSFDVNTVAINLP